MALGAGDLPGGLEGILSSGGFNDHIRAASVSDLSDDLFRIGITAVDGYMGNAMLPDKGQAAFVNINGNDLGRLIKPGAQHGANACGACADDGYNVIFTDLADFCAPVSCREDVSCKDGLSFGNIIRDLCQSVLGKRNADIFRLSSVNAAA